MIYVTGFFSCDRYEFEFLLASWLLLPFTDGAGIAYDYITKPFIAPIAQKVKRKMEGWASVFLVVVNASYLWIVWFALLNLPDEGRRFLTICLGTIYPMAASTVAITTESQTREARFWLTYWACYSILFVAMDYLENFVGSIRGFYSLCALATLYLFLPMFQGADIIFRRVLVPLAVQHENLLLYDAYLVRLDLEQSIPEKQRERVLARAASVFAHMLTKSE
jgi:receptor expression-enhancing protein 5/6